MIVDPQLPYYNHIKEELSGSQLSKAKKFIELKKVVRLADSKWFVSFIPGYNTRMYTVIQYESGFTCNCQYNRTKNKVCSHIMAVMIFEGYKVD